MHKEKRKKGIGWFELQIIVK